MVGVEQFFSIELLVASIRMTIPLLYVALGGLISEKSGVFALGLEGMMLTGCLAGFMGDYIIGNPWMGLLIALLAGAFIGLIYAFITVTLGADQIIASLAINLMAFGLTGSVFRGYFGATVSQLQATGLQAIHIPFLSDIPVIGPVLFNHILPVYLALILVFVLHFVFYRTTWGLKLRAVGEKPRAADSLGVSVNRIRFLSVVISGALAGVGGAVLSVGYLNTFLDGMSAGRGYLAFSAIMFGNWSPFGILLACFIFGSSYAASLRLQALNVGLPFQFLNMLPYVITLIALFAVRRSHSPSNIGWSYKKEEA